MVDFKPILFSVVLLATLQRGWAAPRIVGGSLISIEEVPYIVQLEESGSQICVCSILSEEYVLCAAQCISSMLPQKARFRAGSERVGAGGSLHSMLWGYDHPHFYNKYGLYYWEYDVGVAKVDPPFVFDETRQPIRISRVPPEVGAVGLIAGWGNTEGGGQDSDYLLAVNITVQKDSLCDPAPGLQFCAADEGVSACSGDWGTPFVVDGVIFGLATQFEYCRTFNTYINTANSTFLDFIEQTTGLTLP